MAAILDDDIHIARVGNVGEEALLKRLKITTSSDDKSGVQRHPAWRPINEKSSDRIAHHRSAMIVEIGVYD